MNTLRIQCTLKTSVCINMKKNISSLTNQFIWRSLFQNEAYYSCMKFIIINLGGIGKIKYTFNVWVLIVLC